STAGIQGDAAIFYEMTYQAVLSNLQSTNHQLHLSDDVPGIYFFRSSTNKTWDETPFAFDDAVKKVFAHVEDLPATRQKEKVGKYELPRANTQKGNPARREKKNERKDRSTEPS